MSSVRPNFPKPPPDIRPPLLNSTNAPLAFLAVWSSCSPSGQNWRGQPFQDRLCHASSGVNNAPERKPQSGVERPGPGTREARTALSPSDASNKGEEELVVRLPGDTHFVAGLGPVVLQEPITKSAVWD